MNKKLRFHQQGAEMVEFAFVAIFFFILLFGVFEFARLLYTWNVLNEATRRGARMAVVCPYLSPIPRNVAVFNSLNDTTSSSIVRGLKPDDVTVAYLDDTGVATAVLTEIDFVQVTITYQHNMLFARLFVPFMPSGWAGTFHSPSFQTTLPAESLGADPTFTLPAKPVTCDY